MTNWGRWGAEDELGALNLITPEKVRAAVALVKEGRVYGLAQPLRSSNVPMSTRGGRPLHLFALDGGDYAAGARPQNGFAMADDYLLLRVHANTTHVDSLAHVWREGKLYNGFSSDTVRSTGIRRCGIEKASPLMTRGLLLDIPALSGAPHLEGGHEIAAAELEEALGRAGDEVEPGDAVLIRTGWYRVYFDDPQAYKLSAPGIGLEAASWLAERDVCLIGTDTMGVEVTPYQAGTTAPVHQFLLRDHGIYLLELLDLEGLAADGVMRFLFTLAPLRIEGGGGSPVNPLATV